MQRLMFARIFRQFIYLISFSIRLSLQCWQQVLESCYLHLLLSVCLSKELARLKQCFLCMRICFIALSERIKYSGKVYLIGREAFAGKCKKCQPLIMVSIPEALKSICEQMNERGSFGRPGENLSIP